MKHVLLGVAITVSAACASAEPCDSRLRVAVDIGHDLRASGTVSARGHNEYAFNARLGGEVLATLNATEGIDAFVIESKGARIRLEERPKRAKARNADVFISLHHDSAQEQFLNEAQVNGKKVRYTEMFEGYSLFYSEKNPYADLSLAVAKSIGAELRMSGLRYTDHHAMDVKGERRELVDTLNGVYRFDNLAVLKAAMPSVLFEAGVIVNPMDEDRINNPQYRKLIVAALVRGLDRMRCTLAGNGRKKAI